MISIKNSFDFVLSVEAQQLIRQYVANMDGDIEEVEIGRYSWSGGAENLYTVVAGEGDDKVVLFNIDLNPEGDPVIFE